MRGMSMRLSRLLAAAAFLFCFATGMSVAGAAIQVVSVTEEYTPGDGETQEVALERAIFKARRQAELKAAVYVESYTHWDTGGMQDEIDLITGQIVSGPENLRKEWLVTGDGDAHVRVSAKFRVDTGKIAEALRKRNEQTLDLYKALRKSSQWTEKQAEGLKQAARQADAAERQNIKEKLIANEHRFLAEKALYEGNALFAKEQYQQALDCYRKAVQADPDYALAHYNSAASYQRLGEYDQALAEFGRAGQHDPFAYQQPYYQAYVARGNLNRGLGHDEAAMADYDFVIHAYRTMKNGLDRLFMFRECIGAYCGRAEVYRNRQAYVRAIEVFDEAAKAGLSSPGLSIGRGAVYIDMKEYDRAIEQFNKVLKNKTNYARAAADRADASFYRGNAYFHKGNLLQAAADYGESIALNPENAAAFANRAVVYWNLERYPEALADAEKAVSLSPENGQYQRVLSLVKRDEERFA